MLNFDRDPCLKMLSTFISIKHWHIIGLASRALRKNKRQIPGRYTANVTIPWLSSALCCEK